MGFMTAQGSAWVEWKADLPSRPVVVMMRVRGGRLEIWLVLEEDIFAKFGLHVLSTAEKVLRNDFVLLGKS